MMDRKTDSQSSKTSRIVVGSAIGIAIGSGVGTAFGVALHNIALGVALGISIGLVIGSAIWAGLGVRGKKRTSRRATRRPMSNSARKEGNISFVRFELFSPTNQNSEIVPPVRSSRQHRSLHALVLADCALPAGKPACRYKYIHNTYLRVIL
jgi:hypothetical protein